MLLKCCAAWHHDYLLGELVPVLHHPVGEEPFRNVQPKPPLAYLPAVPLGPIIGRQGEEISACPSSSSREDAVDRDEVSPQSLLLQAEQTK